MLPRVIVHNMVSADGRTDWLPVDWDQYQESVDNWSADTVLAGSKSILVAHPSAGMQESPTPVAPPEEDDQRPLLVVVDSAGVVKGWGHLREQPDWRGVVALCSEATPKEHLEMLTERAVPHIVTGITHVDLKDALVQLADRFGVRVVRVYSGGTLNGFLLRLGLVSVVSVLVHPWLVGGVSAASMFRSHDPRMETDLIELRLVGVERLERDVVWLRYLIVK